MNEYYCIRAETVEYCVIVHAYDIKAAAEIAESALACEMEERRKKGYVRLVREINKGEMEDTPRLYQTKNGYEQ